MLLKEMCRLARIGGDKNDIYYLLKEQLKTVEEDEQDYKNGQFISNEEANKEIEEWIGE